MNKFQNAVAGLGLAAILGVPLAVVAQTANYSSVHKWVDAATSKTYVYVPGQTPAAAVAGFTSEKAPATRVVTLNNCGVGYFTKSTTSPPVMITGANWPATSGAAPTCTKAVAPATGYVGSLDSSPVGTTIDDGTKIYVKGGSGPGSVTLQITASGNITTKANACGFLRVAVSTSRPLTNFKIGATSYTFDSLPSVTAPMICRKTSPTTSAVYVPAN